MRPIVSDTPYKHIYIMDDGRAMIGGTRIKVQYIIIGCYVHGYTPEEICNDYALTLGQVHSALAFYWDHKKLVDIQIEEEGELVELIRELTEHPNQRELNQKLKEKWKAMKADRSEAGLVESS